LTEGTRLGGHMTYILARGLENEGAREVAWGHVHGKVMAYVA